jgi:hypothetical protein
MHKQPALIFLRILSPELILYTIIVSMGAFHARHDLQLLANFA